MLLLLGCSDITEYTSTVTAGLNLYDSETLAYSGSFPVPASARAMFLKDNRIYISCADGFLRSFHTETKNLMEEVKIGQASPSGYNVMAYNHFLSTLYIAGSTGNIIEVSIPDCEIRDDFSVCAFPVLMTVTSGDPGYLWVVDGVENSVCQVHLATSGFCGSKAYPEICQIRDIEASTYDDSLLIATSLGCYELSTSGPGLFRTRIVNGFTRDCISLATIPDDSNFVAVVEYGNMRIGEFWVYEESLVVDPPDHFFNWASIEGSSFITAPGSEDTSTYLLAGGTPSGTVLSVYTIGEDFGVHQSVEVPGSPLDIKEYNGEVYVLTYQ